MKNNHIWKGLVACLMVLPLSACSLSSLNQNHSNEKVSSSDHLPSGYFANANKARQDQAGQQVQLHLISKSLRKSYKGLFKVEYVEPLNIIRLTPVDKSVKQLIKLSKQNNTSAIKNWNQFVVGVRKTSLSVSNQVKGNNVRLAIVDPNHINTILYSAANNKTVSNKFK